MPNLRSLNLEITLEGLVSCWRKSQATALTEMFRPFPQLPMRSVTVMITDYNPDCLPSFLSPACRQQDMRLDTIQYHAV